MNYLLPMMLPHITGETKHASFIPYCNSLFDKPRVDPSISKYGQDRCNWILKKLNNNPSIAVDQWGLLY